MPSHYPQEHPLCAGALKEKQRRLREGFPQSLTLRIHRAISWLTRAGDETADPDVDLILLWIGFNAVYAGDINDAFGSERGRMVTFFSTLIGLDSGDRIYKLIWQRFPNEIRLLLDNRYVFAPFWAHHNGVPGNEDWEAKLARGRIKVNDALRNKDTVALLTILFDRLYVLRNQLLHGGATWNSSANRAQVRDGAALLGCLLPVFIDIMMDRPEQPWPPAHYPVVD